MRLPGASKRPDTPCCCLRFYGLVVSLWLRPIAGRGVMRFCIVRSFPWVSRWTPPWRARRAVQVGGGLVWCVLGRVGLMVMSGCPFRDKGAALARGLLQRWLGVSAGKVRANLASTLCLCPLSVPDPWPVYCPKSPGHVGYALSLPCPPGSDRAAFGAQVSPAPHLPAIGRVSLPNPPCGLTRRQASGS